MMGCVRGRGTRHVAGGHVRYVEVALDKGGGSDLEAGQLV